MRYQALFDSKIRKSVTNLVEVVNGVNVLLGPDSYLEFSNQDNVTFLDEF